MPTKKSEKKKAKANFNPKILIGFGAALALFLGVVLVVEGSIDTRQFRERFISLVEKQTGKQVSIRGAVTVTLLPTPTVYFPGIELRDDAIDEPAPAVTVELLTLSISPATLFSDSPEISAIQLQRPVLELTRAEDHLIHWDWMNPGMLRGAAAGTGRPLDIEILEGRILYHDDRKDSDIEIENINAVIGTGPNLRSGGSFMLFGHDVRFSSDTQPDTATSTIRAEGSTPFHLNLSSNDKSSIKLTGNMNWKDDLPQVEGNVDIDLPDVQAWTKAKTQTKKKLLEAVTNEFTRKQEDTTLLPLKLKGDWAQQGLNIQLANVSLQGLNSAGAGTMSVTWQEWVPTLSIDMKFTALDYNQWRLLAEKTFANQKKARAERVIETSSQVRWSLPKEFQISLSLESDQLYVGNQIWNKARLSADLADEAITVNQFDIELPGGSALSMFGIFSQGSTTGLRFEGGMETSGKSLRTTLTIFDESAMDLPETGFGDFYIRSIIFVSSEQMRLSEADVKISDLRLNGGLVAYFDVNPRIEADVKLKDINFDYFRNVWREREMKAGNRDAFLKFDKNLNFGWLKKLSTTIDLKINVDQFTFLERKGDNAAFRIFVRSGEFGIYDIHFFYPNETTEASLMLDVKGDQPFFNVMLNTNELNTNYFSVDIADEPTAPVSDPSVQQPGSVPPPPVPSLTQPNNSLPPLPPPLDTGAPPAIPSTVPPPPPATGAAPPIPSSAQPAAAAPVGAPATAAPAAPVPEGDPMAPIALAPALPPDNPPVAPAPAPAARGQPAAPPAAAPPAAEPVTVTRPPAAPAGDGKVVITPQSQHIVSAANETALPSPPKLVEGIQDIRRREKGPPDENKKRWPEDLIDMSWMEGFSGSIDLTVGRLLHHGKQIDHLKLQAKLENNLLTLQTLTFGYWQARCSVLGSMYGGQVPGLSISFTLYGVELRDMLTALSGHSNITGRASLSGTLNTSGVNYLSWISQADAKLVLSARGVNVDGINLQGVVDAVNVSRTAADVFNNVNRELVDGTTTFSAEGNLNVKNGIIKTPGVTLKTDTIIGGMTGELRLVPWTMDLSTQYQFPAMTSETIPTMTVQLDGSIDAPELKTDTSSLEAYVAKRITGR